jgi:NAD(P)-dependent dehydrogenase (short-subunit alcohol dehydrogenase family)
METEPQADLLRNRSIVIVGGTTGLGLSAARACANAGANLILVGRTEETGRAAVDALGSCAHFVRGDVNNPATAELAIDAALTIFGSLHGLYHVAGGSGRSAGDGPLHELTEDGLETTIHWNLQSLIYTNRAAVRAFLRQGEGGTILNMSSVLGYSPAPTYFATHAYAAAKGGIISFSRSCAAYYAPHNIRFNVLAPALVETPMSARSIQNQTIMQYIATKQPLDGGRIGSPSDLDAAVVFFLSDASRFATGQVLAIDGGWSVTEGVRPS